MAKAFVLVNTEIRKEEEALKYLQGLPYVRGAYPVYGVYDIVAEVEAASEEKLKEHVLNMRESGKIYCTNTLRVIE